VALSGDIVKQTIDFSIQHIINPTTPGGGITIDPILLMGIVGVVVVVIIIAVVAKRR
jgi:hypothetical protein